MRVFLAIGSNAGDRLAHLRKGVSRLRAVQGVKVIKISSLYETSPVGVSRQANFLNGCVLIETSRTPVGVLVEAKRLESQAGRKPARKGSPRPLDVDLLFYGSQRFKNGVLTLPHPRVTRRRFVLAPLAELTPRWRAPLASLKDTGQNVKIYRRTPEWTRKHAQQSHDHPLNRA